MLATDLTPEIWNAIADQIRRATQWHEIAFSEVTKVDKVNHWIWADDFGDMPIPVVAFTTSFSYYDTLNDGTVRWKGDNTQQNSAYQTQIIMPDVGDTAVILDLAGTRNFPICIGLLLSQPGFWETD